MKHNEIETQKLIANAEECLRRLINSAAESAAVRAVAPAVIDTGASDFDSVVGYVDLFCGADADEDEEVVTHEEELARLKRAWEELGFPPDLVGDEIMEGCVFATLPRAYWNQAFCKFGFPEFDEKFFSRMW